MKHNEQNKMYSSAGHLNINILTCVHGKVFDLFVGKICSTNTESFTQDHTHISQMFLEFLLTLTTKKIITFEYICAFRLT